MDKLKNLLFLASQYLLPHHLTSRIVGTLAESEIAFVRKPLIRFFSKKFNISLEEAVVEDPNDFKCFNDFFTRELKPDARLIAPQPDEWSSPVDGEISQFGKIKKDQLIQAKNHNFSLSSLFGGDLEMASRYEDGDFMTIYLSPSDYHRIHMPLDATLIKTTFIPGRLYSVNQLTAETIDGVFAKNERLVCEFDSKAGKFTMVLVGAMIVASIETTWSGIVAPVQRKIEQTDLTSIKPIRFQKGDEMGRFRLGSTVIMTFEPEQMKFAEHLELATKVKMGESIGNSLQTTEQ